MSEDIIAEEYTGILDPLSMKQLSNKIESKLQSIDSLYMVTNNQGRNKNLAFRSTDQLLPPKP
jgi:hypothetical protein